MAAVLALLSAVWFALSAALQQRGQFALARSGTPVEGVAGLVRLVAVPVWLLGTLVLLLGYATQGAALDRGKLVVVQPLMVTTIVWALPLRRWLTHQQSFRARSWGPARSWSGSRCSSWSETRTPASTAQRRRTS
jgi:hypothetical protein